MLCKSKKSQRAVSAAESSPRRGNIQIKLSVMTKLAEKNMGLNAPQKMQKKKNLRLAPKAGQLDLV